MKLLKYSLISFVCLVSVNEVFACWDPWYSPNGYYMYRVYEEQLTNSLQTAEYYPGAKDNCVEWQRLTSKNIPIDDIYSVVYKMSLEEFEAIYDDKETIYENKFAEWITKKDTAILDFLLLAKTNEHIRLKRNSRWYYPSMKVGARMTIEEIAEKALSVKDARLRDRYLLQGIRALFSMSKYTECVEIWEREISHLPENNLMRKLVHPYIVGAEFHIKRSEKAIEYFAELGDIGSVLYCAGRTGENLSTIDALELVCEYAPNSKYIEKELQSYIRDLEPLDTSRWYDDFEMTPEIQKLNSLCLKMGRNDKSNNKGMWYYTAAFLADLNGEAARAAYLLDLAEKSKSSDYIKESIQVFRIYLDAKLQPYNSAYEDRLFTQLKWLDSMICNNLTDQVCKETSNGYMLVRCESYYYWNDVMRRILLSEVCPRMIKAGKTTRALQLANMADNRLLGLVNKSCLFDFVEVGDSYEYQPVVTYTMTEYRYSEQYNVHDYSNHFFEMIDSLGVSTAVNYVNTVKYPKSKFDSFLNSRGYVGNDYLNDIVGTQYLRNMRYGEALKYLGNVSVAYKRHHNVYMEFDPFCFDIKSIGLESDFRYDFAKEMNSLEKNINATIDPNRKAKLMLKFAIGIKNSFDRCWGLTQYYRGTTYWGQVCEKRDWEDDEYTKSAMNRSQELIKKACEIATDDEVAADIHYELCHYLTIAEKYPNTARGVLVRGHCDNLVDYKR